MAVGEAPGEEEGEERARRVEGMGLGFLSTSMSSSRYSSFRESGDRVLWTPQGSAKGELAFPSHFKWRAAEKERRGKKSNKKINK